MRNNILQHIVKIQSDTIGNNRRCSESHNRKQQEPKLTADLSNDEKFIAECAAGKDAYGTVASLAFNKPYEDCLELYLDENGKKTDRINKEGKERRNQAKSILLGK